MIEEEKKNKKDILNHRLKDRYKKLKAKQNIYLLSNKNFYF